MLMPYNGVPHLFVILSDPCKDGLCLVVMLTSIKAKRVYDPSCILMPGDHPFVKHGTYALFRMAEQIRAPHIANMVNKGLFTKREDASENLLAALCEGLQQSEETRPRILKYAKKVGAI